MELDSLPSSYTSSAYLSTDQTALNSYFTMEPDNANEAEYNHADIDMPVYSLFTII